MSRTQFTDAEQHFVDQVRHLEEKLFQDHLDENDLTRMKNDGKYSWLYRPSHHIETRLIMQADIKLLSQSGKRLLSVGAHPAYLEKVLCELGIPAENIVIADSDAAIADIDTPMEKIVFDANQTWPAFAPGGTTAGKPEIGTFDLIIFPESLCISIRDHIKEEGGAADLNSQFPNDAREAELLAAMLNQALIRLRPGGEIRANGPMSHPNVVRAAGKQLDEKEMHHAIDYQRYFLAVRRAEGKSIITID